MMKLETVSKEIIRPSCPTPPELRNHPLCLFDQQTPNVYIEILYFYDSINTSSGSGPRLKDSLSKALTFYYPFAGRLGDGCNVVDCNDMGATFLEAKLPCPMSEFMNIFNSRCDETVRLICLDDMNRKDPRLNPLLSIQLTKFKCGGEVMFVVCSHKVADMASLTNFMDDWATIARISGGRVPRTVCPRFDAASLFCPESDGDSEPSSEEGSRSKREEEDVCSKRLVFEGSKIAALKAMVSEKVENPSRVQILTAFIYKAILSAKKIVTGGLPPTNLLQLINLRTRVEPPPLPMTLMGNIISFFLASSTMPNQKEMELWSLVAEMKRNFEELCIKLPKDYIAEEWGRLYKLHAGKSLKRWRNPEDYILYTCTSWCKFPIYDADFGWGKPVWIDVPFSSLNNSILLMDAKDEMTVL